MTIKTISPQDLYRRMNLGHNVLLVDVRSQDEFEEGHISGAKSYPLKGWNAKALIHKLSAPFPTPPTIYIICASGSQSKEASQKLADAGHEYIAIIEGGIRAWQKAGFPIKVIKKAASPPRLEIMQQIEIAVGSVVIIGTLLGTFVNTAFLAFSLLAGLALAYEGIFGTDYLKQALSKMFWNRETSQ